ncbi:dipicolinate synthase subunit DpsA, partial [Methanobrevibacter sp.]|uniref:dipicolinate synthase subunit DpsA n=1 Tax=Methanobrevibacter sp. TaxID=66852 RepID=UPI00388D3467
MFSVRNICFIGGDRRSISTALFLKSKGYDVSVIGLKSNEQLAEYTDLTNAISNSDAIVLPLPLTRDNVSVNAPLSNEIYYLSDIIKLKPQFIFGGIIKGEFKEQLKKAGIKHYDYYDSEYLTVKNAVLTAEAALSIAINETEGSIYGSKSIVIGYGRIGKQLSKYLKTLGSKVIATSRNEGTLATIEAEGLIPLKTDNCFETCLDADYIFNTVPFPVLNPSFFEKCSPDLMFLDLASNSGIDLAKAKLRNLKCGIYGGLPGKYSSKTAGIYVAEE